jgi:hypothetical protein
MTVLQLGSFLLIYFDTSFAFHDQLKLQTNYYIRPLELREVNFDIY